MAVARTKSFSLRPDTKPLLIALAIAAGVHLMLVYAVVSLAFLSILFSDKSALAELHRFQLAKTNLPPMDQVPTLIFTEVNPDQVSSVAPKNPKFYSSQNSVAANPDSKADTEMPKIDGTQTHVPKTEDVPRTQAFPLQPTPQRPQPEPVKTAENPPKVEQKPGDLALMKPTEPKPPEPAPEHVRPRTLAQALAQNPLAGQKMKQEGGTKNVRTAASFDTIGSAFGEYDARIIGAIQQHWYDLVDAQAAHRDRTGKVVVQFHLNYDGRITEMKVLERESTFLSTDLLSYLCQAAIQDPAPYEPWPVEMRRIVGAEYREVRFTFYYE
jgi:outer membrane biosynthesis protein TonB